MIAVSSSGDPTRSMGTLRAQDETFVRDCLHVILVRVAGAEESLLHRNVVHGVYLQLRLAALEILVKC